jgi:hypothetical protein
VEAQSSGYAEVYRQNDILGLGAGGWTWTAPTIANGKLYLRSHSGLLVCYDVSGGNGPPVIGSISATPDIVTLPGTSTVVVTATDPDGDTMTYTWARTSGPTGVGFSPNGTAESDSTTATFPAAGTYVLGVTVDDGRGGTATGSVTVVVQKRPGDLDGNGVVNAVDLGIVVTNFGTEPPADPLADADGDGVVNALDLAIVVGNFGT